MLGFSLFGSLGRVHVAVAAAAIDVARLPEERGI